MYLYLISRAIFWPFFQFLAHSDIKELIFSNNLVVQAHTITSHVFYRVHYHLVCLAVSFQIDFGQFLAVTAATGLTMAMILFWLWAFNSNNFEVIAIF
jgi:hypothetical protein